MELKPGPDAAMRIQINTYEILEISQEHCRSRETPRKQKIKTMKVTEHLQNANGKPLFSFEILPPVKGQHIQSVFDAIDPLMEFKPPFIDVTYHRGGISVQRTGKRAA